VLFLITIPAVSAASAVVYDPFVCLIHLEQESADLGSLALREHFLHHLLGGFLSFAQLDYSRRHSPRPTRLGELAAHRR
jgi:hypothetical protein